MIRALPDEVQLEHDEQQIRRRVSALSPARRKAFYDRQMTLLKDPDTYAALTWLFIGGFHHLYLGRVGLFAAEFLCLSLAVLLLWAGAVWAWLILAGLFLYELPQLFFSQRIIRHYNYRQALSLLDAIEQKP